MIVINMTSKQIPVFQPASGGTAMHTCCIPTVEPD